MASCSLNSGGWVLGRLGVPETGEERDSLDLMAVLQESVCLPSLLTLQPLPSVLLVPKLLLSPLPWSKHPET